MQLLSRMPVEHQEHEGGRCCTAAAAAAAGAYRQSRSRLQMHSSVGKQTNERTFVNMSRWFSFARSWTLMTLCTIGMSLPLMLNTTTSPAGQQAGCMKHWLHCCTQCRRGGLMAVSTDVCEQCTAASLAWQAVAQGHMSSCSVHMCSRHAELSDLSVNGPCCKQRLLIHC